MMFVKRVREEEHDELLLIKSERIEPTWKRQAWHQEETHQTPPPPPPTTTKAKKRVFTCKTCNRTFPTFQALGGHRTAHNDTRVRRRRCDVVVVPDDATPGVKKLRRAHECSICGEEFAVGQALGGHMRRHRTGDGGEPMVDGDRGGRLCLDLSLSLSPPDDSVAFPNLRLGLGF